mgnify:CR=1 FL=1
MQQMIGFTILHQSCRWDTYVYWQIANYNTDKNFLKGRGKKCSSSTPWWWLRGHVALVAEVMVLFCYWPTIFTQVKLQLINHSSWVKAMHFFHCSIISYLRTTSVDLLQLQYCIQLAVPNPPGSPLVSLSLSLSVTRMDVHKCAQPAHMDTLHKHKYKEIFHFPSHFSGPAYSKQ